MLSEHLAGESEEPRAVGNSGDRGLAHDVTNTCPAAWEIRSVQSRDK